MTSKTNLFLVGPMGAGKTTIGRQLAEALNMDFLDSDHEIENRSGATIPWIFDVEGEEGFRKRERAIIDELTQRQNIVLATGGGAVLSEANRQCLKSRGTVIYLSASIEQLINRTQRDRNRPLLQTEDPRARLEELMQIRDPLYREVADIIIKTDHSSIRSSVNRIIQQLKKPPS
ncbi:MAG: shikimate kinase AroK [Thiohalomonadales bacterium]|nr:shikimate kinase AroK [Thiohalomonadales bacterium]